MSALYTYYFGMMDLGAPSQLPEIRKRKELPADVSVGQLRSRRGSYEEMTFFVKSTIILIHRVSRVNLAHSVQVSCFGLRCWVAFRIYRFAYHTLVIALHLHWYFAHSLNVLIASSVSWSSFSRHLCREANATTDFCRIPRTNPPLSTVSRP